MEFFHRAWVSADCFGLIFCSRVKFHSPWVFAIWEFRMHADTMNAKPISKHAQAGKFPGALTNSTMMLDQFYYRVVILQEMKCVACPFYLPMPPTPLRNRNISR